MKFPTMDEFAQMVADKAIDEVEYNGRTLRQWTEIIFATEIYANNDAISRRELQDKFEQWQKTEDYSNDEWNLLVDVLSVIKSMPPAPQLSTNLAEVGTDCISRQAAIDALNRLRESTYSSDYGIVDCDDAINAIAALPLTEPKKGKWIKTARWGRVYYCDQCRNFLDFDGVNVGRGSTNFCPNCGSRNEVTT